MAEYDDCIVFLLAKAYQRAHGEMKKHLQAYGLTPVQYLILEVLWEEEGLSAGELGRRLHLDSATVSGVLDRMAEAGWIIKGTRDVDKRFLRLFATPRARNLLATLRREKDEVNAKVLRGLRLEEQLLLKRMLRDLQG